MMTEAFFSIAWIVLIWAWAYPEKVGKWAAKFEAGLCLARAALSQDDGKRGGE